MRRLIAIVFLATLLFNFYGYRLMIDYLQHQQADLLTARLDREQYSEADLVVIKTPLHLPYYTGSPDYERVQGSIDIEGVTYQYVKRRVHHDTLELLCVPNRGHMQLETAGREFFKRSLEGDLSGNSQPHTTVKIALPDYCQEWPLFSLQSPSAAVVQHCARHTTLPHSGYLAPGEQPPESMPLFS